MSFSTKTVAQSCETMGYVGARGGAVKIVEGLLQRRGTFLESERYPCEDRLGCPIMFSEAMGAKPLHQWENSIRGAQCQQ